MEEGNAVLEGIEFLAAMIGYAGVAFIAAGCFLGLVQYCRRLLTGKVHMSEVRVTLGTYVLIGMEFLVGQDIIETVIDTQLDQLKSLALVVVIRTVLEHFLGKEVQHLSHEAEKHGQSFHQTSVGRMLPVRRTPRVAIAMALVIAAAGISAVHIFGSSAEEAFAHGREGGEGREESEEARHGSREHEGREHGGREHGGREHGGREHGGREHGGREHGGREHGGRQAHGGFGMAGEEEGGRPEHGRSHRAHGEEERGGAEAAEGEGEGLAEESRGEGERGEPRRAGIDPKAAKAMGRIVAFLRRNQRKSGSFASSVSLEGRRKRGYSLELQTHAIYALARYAEVVESKSARSAILRSARAVARRHVRTGPEGTMVVSGARAGSEGEAALRVDDVSLVLVALLEAQSIESKVVSRGLLVDLGRLLVSMQREGGRFVYSPEEPTRSARTPGRAVYALVRLDDVVREALWRRAALEGASYVFRQEGADCGRWILRSGSSLVRMGQEDDGEFRVAEVDLRRCAEGQARKFIARTRRSFEGRRRRPCMAHALPATQPLEAVLAFNSENRGEGVDVLGFEGLANRSIRRLLRCQVRNGRTRGGFMGLETRRGINTEHVQSALATFVAYERRQQGARGGER